MTIFAGLNASLLVRHPDTKVLYVNFDPAIIELIAETKCLAKLQLDIPEAAKNLAGKHDNVKDTEVA